MKQWNNNLIVIILRIIFNVYSKFKIQKMHWCSNLSYYENYIFFEIIITFWSFTF